MPVHISDYLPHAHASLPLSIGDVERSINSKGGRDMIYKKLAPLFSEHHVDEIFGLGLLHRHFDLSPNERLVQVGSVTTPWPLTKISDIAGGPRAIFPTAWLFYEDKLVPYEFTFIGNNVAKAKKYPHPADYPAFLEALSARLKELGVHKYFSLILHPGPDFKGSVEFTVGRANICVAPELVSIKHTVEAVFCFDPGYIARGYAQKCDHGKCD